MKEIKEMINDLGGNESLVKILDYLEQIQY